MGSYGEKQQSVFWGNLVETLQDNECDETARRLVRLRLLIISSFSVPREMWDLINVNDSPTLTVEQLESGVATVTQSEDFFDCHPAVVAAFNFTKKRFETNEEEEIIKEKGKPKTLEFSEFKIFLTLLRQYYVYCQVSNTS